MLCSLIKVKYLRNKGNLLHSSENFKFPISKSIGYPNSLYSMKVREIQYAPAHSAQAYTLLKR